MSMIIRVLYNNQGWRGSCQAPGKDIGCWQCFEENVDIKLPQRTDEVCTGHCWEQHLCVDYKWGCTPKGRVFGYQAYPETKVFFVFKQPDGNYTLWGKTTIRAVDDEPREEGQDYEVGFAFIHFNPFEPLPKERWVKNLSSVQLVDKQWLMGRYRYIDAEREAYLEQLIEGEVPREQTGMPAVAPTSDGIGLNIYVTPSIHKKLEGMAKEEGRSIDEIVREAIAEWMKGRQD